MKKGLYFGLVIVLLANIIGVSGCKTAPESSFLEMLKLVPNNPNTRYQVLINDFTKVREIYSIPPPSTDATDTVINEYIRTLMGGDSLQMGGQPFGELSFISGMGPGSYAFASPIRRQNIGFGPQDVDMDILAGVPPMVFEAAKGRYNPVVIKDALNNYKETDSPHHEEYNGITVYDWGYDGNELNLTRRLSPPFFDDLGRCRPLGVGEGYVLRAFDVESIEMMMDASKGQLISLADNPDFSLMATALTEMGAYSVFLTDQVQLMSAESLLDSILASFLWWVEDPEKIEELKRQLGVGVKPIEPVLGAYETMATGIGKDSDGVFMAVVLVYYSSEKADSNVPIFEQRIEEGTSVEMGGNPWRDYIDSSDVWASGRTLRAKLRGSIINIWLRVWSEGYSLFLWGED